MDENQKAIAELIDRIAKLETLNKKNEKDIANLQDENLSLKRKLEEVRGGFYNQP